MERVTGNIPHLAGQGLPWAAHVDCGAVPARANYMRVLERFRAKYMPHGGELAPFEAWHTIRNALLVLQQSVGSREVEVADGDI
eukprot:1176788-Prorocentrum_minimum.AAC.1